MKVSMSSAVQCIVVLCCPGVCMNVRQLSVIQVLDLLCSAV